MLVVATASQGEPKSEETVNPFLAKLPPVIDWSPCRRLLNDFQHRTGFREHDRAGFAKRPRATCCHITYFLRTPVASFEKELHVAINGLFDKTEGLAVTRIAAASVSDY